MPGMTAAVKSELDTLREIIVSTVAVEQIWLFGSHAGGTPGIDSDIDLYVVVPDSEEDTAELCGKIRLGLSRRKTPPIDLLVGKKSIFENRRNRLTLEKVVATEGVRIYG